MTATELGRGDIIVVRAGTYLDNVSLKSFTRLIGESGVSPARFVGAEIACAVDDGPCSPGHSRSYRRERSVSVAPDRGVRE